MQKNGVALVTRGEGWWMTPIRPRGRSGDERAVLCMRGMPHNDKAWGGNMHTLRGYRLLPTTGLWSGERSPVISVKRVCVRERERMAYFFP